MRRGLGGDVDAGNGAADAGHDGVRKVEHVRPDRQPGLGRDGVARPLRPELAAVVEAQAVAGRSGNREQVAGLAVRLELVARAEEHRPGLDGAGRAERGAGRLEHEIGHGEGAAQPGPVGAEVDVGDLVLECAHFIQLLRRRHDARAEIAEAVAVEVADGMELEVGHGEGAAGVAQQRRQRHAAGEFGAEHQDVVAGRGVEEHVGLAVAVDVADGPGLGARGESRDAGELGRHLLARLSGEEHQAGVLEHRKIVDGVARAHRADAKAVVPAGDIATEREAGIGRELPLFAAAAAVDSLLAGAERHEHVRRLSAGTLGGVAAQEPGSRNQHRHPGSVKIGIPQQVGRLERVVGGVAVGAEELVADVVQPGGQGDVALVRRRCSRWRIGRDRRSRIGMHAIVVDHQLAVDVEPRAVGRCRNETVGRGAVDGDLAGPLHDPLRAEIVVAVETGPAASHDRETVLAVGGVELRVLLAEPADRNQCSSAVEVLGHALVEIGAERVDRGPGAPQGHLDIVDGKRFGGAGAITGAVREDVDRQRGSTVGDALQRRFAAHVEQAIGAGTEAQ